MSIENNIDVKGLAVSGMRELFKDKVSETQMKEYEDTIAGTNTKYSCQGTALLALVYCQLNLDITSGDNRKSFTGNGGGLFFAGGGQLIGDLYTDDLERLYRDTHAFEVNIILPYCQVFFFDKSSHLLGNFHAGAISNSGGTGGGTGKWK